MTDTLSNSDKVVLTKYPSLPSTCVICLRSSDGVLEFIDFQMSLDIYGSVNICVECVALVAKGLLGFVEPSGIDALTQQIANLVEINRELKKENDLHNATLDALLKLRPNLNNDSVDSPKSKDEDVRTNDSDLKLEFDI